MNLYQYNTGYLDDNTDKSNSGSLPPTKIDAERVANDANSFYKQIIKNTRFANNNKIEKDPSKNDKTK